MTKDTQATPTRTFNIYDCRAMTSYEYKTTGTIEDVAQMQAGLYAGAQAHIKLENAGELYLTLTYADSNVVDRIIIMAG